MKKSEILEVLDEAGLGNNVKDYFVYDIEEADTKLLVVQVKEIGFMELEKLKSHILVIEPKDEKTIEITFNSDVEID